MAQYDVLRLNGLVGVAARACMLAIAVLISAAPAVAQTPAAPPGPSSLQPPPAPALKNWRDGMAHARPTKTGCFTSSYPSTQWQEVPCQAPPAYPSVPARGARPSIVGDGNDVVAGVTSDHISLAVGSFDSVSGVTDLTSHFGGNDYALQLNTNTFNSPVCDGAGTPSSCVGWQQFIYSQGQCTNGGQSAPCVFMQYWLLGWGSTTCPANWMYFKNGNDDECWMNSNTVYPSQPQPLSNLGNLSVLAEAACCQNTLDTVIFSTGTALYAVQANDNVLSFSAEAGRPLSTIWSATAAVRRRPSIAERRSSSGRALRATAAVRALPRASPASRATPQRRTTSNSAVRRQPFAEPSPRSCSRKTAAAPRQHRAHRRLPSPAARSSPATTSTATARATSSGATPPATWRCG